MRKPVSLVPDINSTCTEKFKCVKRFLCKLRGSGCLKTMTWELACGPDAHLQLLL